MAGKSLTAGVYVDGKFYEAGSTPPAEVAKQIVNPKAWGGEVPEAEPEGPKFPEGEPSEDWKGAELDAYAADKGVEVSGTKVEKVAQLAAAAKSGN